MTAGAEAAGAGVAAGALASVFGAAFLTLMPEWVEFFDTYKDFVHGGILVLVLMFLPQGLITGLTDMVRVRLALRRRDHAAA